MVDLLGVINAVVAGIQLGGFYAAEALGIAIAFGMLRLDPVAAAAEGVVSPAAYKTGARRDPMGPARQ